MDAATKAALIGILLRRLEEDRHALDAAIAELQAAKAGETKSTAGDKYETARAMADLELEKLGMQVQRLEKMGQALQRMDRHRACHRAEFGALVWTAQTHYFLGVAMGKVACEGRTWYAISLDSPIGQALAGKAAGDVVQFQGKSWAIEGVA